MNIRSCRRCCATFVLTAFGLMAAEHHGQVKFGDLPLPGATVTAVQGDKKLVAITDQQGIYSFPDLPDGAWTVQVEMLCFDPVKRSLNISAGVDPASPNPTWDLKLLPLSDIKASIAAPSLPSPAGSTASLSVAASSSASSVSGAASTSTPPGPQAGAAAPANTSQSSKKQNGKKGAASATAAGTAPGNGFQRTTLNASANPPADALPAPAASGGDSAAPSAADLNQSASDALSINGSAVNGASSPFAQSQAFGNNRRGGRPLYTGNVGFIVDNSSLDARAFSLTGQDTAKPAYNHLTGVLSLGGPLIPPRILKRNNGPTFTMNYQWLRNRNATTQSTTMPTADQRAGNFGGATIVDPSSRVPFSGGVIDPTKISSQARALLNLYPLPNFAAGARYNYQIPIVGVTHQDSVQLRVSKTVNSKNQVFGTFGLQSTRIDNPNLFGFLDTTDILGMNIPINWSHRFTTRLFTTAGFAFSRQSTRVAPFFANRENISGEAGITGNDQEPGNWGPPGLSFSSGIAGLNDAQQSLTRNQTSAFSDTLQWLHSPHNITMGGDFRFQQFNLLSQQNARGSFGFTGAATGSDFADFLLGVPTTSSIAFGNADKYFRASSMDAYINDDWRFAPSLTINGGVRWEYGSPITELYGRLVNLDIAPGFAAVAPVVANHPVGVLTGQAYPDSLLHPDRHAFEPRIGISWRPFSASSMVVRAGYGVTYDTSVYQAIATRMAQQSPLSKSLSVANTAANPLTLASGFNAAPGATTNTFAVDPNFRAGYAQNWQVSVQRDLPAALMMVATYLGTKGTRAQQEFLPNTYPQGAVNPCPACPAGYIYLTSNGNSTREAGQIQLRRRLHSGFTSTLQYTYAKAIDDAALGGRGNPLVAQNWLDLSAERSLSSFDQRHLLSVQIQYTTGMGLGGGALAGGWRRALKDWTFVSQINAGSGLPQTPIYPQQVAGTGVTGPLRPNFTGAPLYAAPSGLFLNPAAFVAPAAGQWGNAGRNSITGPDQFTLGASMSRTFRLSDRFSTDVRVDAANALNHVTFSGWNTTVGSPQFGLPASANAMRSVTTTVRVRF